MKERAIELKMLYTLERAMFPASYGVLIDHVVHVALDEDSVDPQIALDQIKFNRYDWMR